MVELRESPRLAIVLGTRPEIIKMAPVIRELEKRKIDFTLIHTGQHYSKELSEVFFRQLELAPPDYNLNVGSGSHAQEVGKMIIRAEQVLLKDRPDAILVQGDTNSTLSGALVASKLGVRLGHVEAGLRSYDRSMPEEINRVLTDHASDFLFAPTETAKSNLLKEGISKRNVSITGNTIVDLLRSSIDRAKESGHAIIDGLGLKDFLLVTLHRQENVDDAEKLGRVVRSISTLSARLESPAIWPIHPRTRNRLTEFDLNDALDGIILMKPVDYFSFLGLEKMASLVLTDSGGVQEETCVLRTPCVTLRTNTERPETLDVGSNVLAGTDSDRIVKSALSMIEVKRNWPNPFGDGHAATRIATHICSWLN
jgi:UDP-N-acetylglucosamine 2-epimerase (non-hydrolysing)